MAPGAAGGATACPHCGAALPSPAVQFCPQCGDTVAEDSAAARVRRLFSSRFLVGALAVVFVLLLAGIVLSGQGDGGASGSTVTAGDVRTLSSPTTTAAAIRNTTSSTPTVSGRGRVPGATNSSQNVTPRVNETVAVVKTLSRYIQNAGGDAGNQLRTPSTPATPAPPSPVPTSASMSIGTLSWSGEGTYVTEPFPLQAGTIQVAMTAGVLTMVQLRDASGTAIGIATAGPESATTAIRVPAPGTYRLEVWPFGAGTWTIAITYASTPTTVPTLAPVIVTSAAPTVIVTTEATTVAPTTTATTTVETTVTTVPTTVETTVVTPTPTQERRSFTGSGTAATPTVLLRQGQAVIGYSTTATGPFSVTLINPDGTVADSIVSTEGPASGSKAISIPVTALYRFNVVATGEWTVRID